MDKKRALVINASPRGKGHISQLLEMAKEDLRAKGFSVTEFVVATSVYRHCTGCMACRTRRECVLPADDAQRFVGLMRDSDILVIGTPCYWGNMPGQLKGLFDRMVYAMMDDNTSLWPRPLMKGKRVAVIATSTTPWPWNRLFGQTSGAVCAIKEIMKYSGIRLVGTLQKGNTHRRHGITPADTRKLHRLMARLAR